MTNRWFLSGNSNDLKQSYKEHGLDNLAAYLVHTWQSDPHLFDTIPPDVCVDLKQATVHIRDTRKWIHTEWHVWREQVSDFWYASFVYWVNHKLGYDNYPHILAHLNYTLQFVGVQTVCQKAQDLLLQTEFLLPDLARIVGHYLGLP